LELFELTTSENGIRPLKMLQLSAKVPRMGAEAVSKWVSV